MIEIMKRNTKGTSRRIIEELETMNKKTEMKGMIVGRTKVDTEITIVGMITELEITT